MSDVKRYDAMGCAIADRGRFVLASDYDALRAELAALKSDIERHISIAASLANEVEALKAAAAKVTCQSCNGSGWKYQGSLMGNVPCPDCAELEQSDHNGDVWCERATKAEAELAALKEKLPCGHPKNMDDSYGGCVWCTMTHTLTTLEDEYDALKAAARKVTCARCYGLGGFTEHRYDEGRLIEIAAVPCPDCADLSALLGDKP